MRRQLTTLAVMFFMALVPLRASGGDARVKLSWEDMKQLLNVDHQTVRLSWSEYVELSRRTSSTPLPVVSTTGGDVVLSKEEFQRLIDSLVAPPAESSNVILSKASYDARIAGNALLVAARIELNVHPSHGKPVDVDLFPASVGFQKILVDGQAALTEERGGRLFLSMKQEGHHVVQINFSVPQREGSVQQIEWPIVRTPITLVQLTVPEENIELHIDQAQEMQTRSVGKSTVVNAVLSPTTDVHASWFPVTPSSKKGPARIYAQVNHLMTIEEDGLRVHANVQVHVLKNTVNEIVLELPEGFDVIDVQGDGVSDWKEKPNHALVLPFKYAREGIFNFDVTLEQVWTKNKISPTYTGLHVKDAVTETGFIGVEVRTNAEVTTSKIDGADQVDIRELPPELVAQAQRPLLFGYRFAHPHVDLHLEVERHNEVAILSSYIDKAHASTWVLEDGQTIHLLTFELRNSWKPFMELALPKNTQLWNAFVSGQPVKPTINSEGHVLIPLNRSFGQNGELAPFSVELVCYQKAQPLALLGRSQLEFPIPDLMVSELEWTTYLPKDQRFAYFGHELERGIKEEIDFRRAKEFRVGAKLAALKKVDKLQADTPMAPKINAPAELGKDQREEDQGELLRANIGRVAGVLPIRIQIPVSGNAQQFSKSIVIRNQPVKMTLYHASDGVIFTVRCAFALTLFAFLVLMFRRFKDVALQFMSQQIVGEQL